MPSTKRSQFTPTLGRRLRERRRTIEADARARDSEVDASLEDGVAAGITVDANPCRGGVLPRAPGGLLGSGHDKGSSHRLVRSLDTSHTGVSIVRSMSYQRWVEPTLLATSTAPAQLLLYST